MKRERMRADFIREAVISRYTPPSRSKSASDKRAKTRASTLEDLYREVHTKQYCYNEYLCKNAAEIESIMRNNRKLIDAKRNPSK